MRTCVSPVPVAAHRLRLYAAAGLRWRRTLAGTAMRLGQHAAAAAMLEAADPALARGATIAADVVALRLAATPATSAADFGTKWAWLGQATGRARVARLLAVAKDVEVEARLSAGLPVDVRSADGAPWHPGGAEVRVPTSRELRTYDALARCEADLSSIYDEVCLTSADMSAIRDRRPELLDGCRARLADVALLLSVRDAWSTAEARIQARLLEALLVSQRCRPALTAILEACVDADRVRWGARSGGTA